MSRQLSPRYPFKTHARVEVFGRRGADGRARVEDGRRHGESYLGVQLFALLAVLVEANQRKTPGDRSGLGAFVTPEYLSAELVRRTRISQHPVDPARLDLNRLIHRLRKALGSAVRRASRAVEWGKRLVEYVPGFGFRISTAPDHLILVYLADNGPQIGGDSDLLHQIPSGAPDEEIVFGHKASGKSKIHRLELQGIDR